MPFKKISLAITAIMSMSAQGALAQCNDDAIKFSSDKLNSFAAQDISGNYSVIDDCTLYVSGNTWVETEQEVHITSKTTELVFGYQAGGDSEGEVHGIALNRNAQGQQVNPFLFYKLHGTQGPIPQFEPNTDHNNYALGQGYTEYRIYVGHLVGKSFRVVFAVDQDVNVGAAALFKNIRIEDYGSPTDPVVTPPPTPTPVVTPEPRPDPSSGDFGVTAINNDTALYWVSNKPEFANGGYLCQDIDVNCQSAERNGAVWQKEFTGMVLGQQYSLQFKPQGASPVTWEFTWDGTNGSGGQPPTDPTPTPTPLVTPPPVSIDCPPDAPYYAAQCGQCFVDINQARESNCVGGDGGSGCTVQSTTGEEFRYSSEFDNGTTNGVPTVLVDVNCAAMVGNGNDGCINTDGFYVSREYSISNPSNTREALLDIEYNLGINIDDNFIAQAGYQGAPPPINPMITVEDARKYFIAVLGEADGNSLASKLNTNGDAWLTRDEASNAKGSDPQQVLGIPSLIGGGGGLATDDVLAYLGLYFGDGALDKYAGDLGEFIMCNLTKFTRTWQPGANAADARYDSNGRYIGY